MKLKECTYLGDIQRMDVIWKTNWTLQWTHVDIACHGTFQWCLCWLQTMSLLVFVMLSNIIACRLPLQIWMLLVTKFVKSWFHKWKKHSNTRGILQGNGCLIKVFSIPGQCLLPKLFLYKIHGWCSTNINSRWHKWWLWSGGWKIIWLHQITSGKVQNWGSSNCYGIKWITIKTKLRKFELS